VETYKKLNMMTRFLGKISEVDFEWKGSIYKLLINLFRSTGVLSKIDVYVRASLTSPGDIEFLIWLSDLDEELTKLGIFIDSLYLFEDGEFGMRYSILVGSGLLRISYRDIVYTIQDLHIKRIYVVDKHLKLREEELRPLVEVFEYVR